MARRAAGYHSKNAKRNEVLRQAVKGGATPEAAMKIADEKAAMDFIKSVGGVEAARKSVTRANNAKRASSAGPAKKKAPAKRGSSQRASSQQKNATRRYGNRTTPSAKKAAARKKAPAKRSSRGGRGR